MDGTKTDQRMGINKCIENCNRLMKSLARDIIDENINIEFNWNYPEAEMYSWISETMDKRDGWYSMWHRKIFDFEEYCTEIQ